MKIADRVIANIVICTALLLAAAAAPARQSATGQAGAADDRPVEYPPVYRAEVIVFRHSDGRSDRIRSFAPADFTDRLDPLLVARANDYAERELSGLATMLPVARIPGEVDETTPWLESEDQMLRPIPPVYSELGELSGQIQRTVDRLLDAPEYDSVSARAWIQRVRRGQPTAAARIHDRNIVALIEPEDTRRLVPVPHMLPFGLLEKTPPRARNVYRLDGTLRLRRRQFLHLDLDLVWQEPARALAQRLPADNSAVAGKSEGAEDEWMLHRLQQSRIVEPGRMEYFDSSLFGVLVKIERFEQVVPEIEVPSPPAPTENASESAQSAGTVDPDTNSGS